MKAANESYNRRYLEGSHLFPKLGRWYFATAASRIEPSLFVIGVQKGGTTSLAQYLSEHPQVIPPQRKDIYFFNNSVNFAKGISWYKAHFAHRLYQKRYEKRNRVSNTITFDPTPNYFPAPGAAERLHKTFPQAKLVLLLRNPVERAWSNYRMCKWHKFETLSFEDALQCEDERIANEEAFSKKELTHNYVLQRLAYRTNGLYAHYLKEWLRFFPADQLLILRSEDLFENPGEIYSQVLSFAGLSPFNGVTFDNPNKGKIESEMNAQTRRELAAFYEPHNQELYQLLGRDMNWR